MIEASSNSLPCNPAITVSAVIPFFNGKEFIDRAVESVLRQTFPIRSIILVNDASDDENSRYIQKFARSTTIFEATVNGGQGRARNLGIALARTSHVAFLDQDDYWDDTHIESLVAALEKRNDETTFAYSDARRVSLDGELLQPNFIGSSKYHPVNNPRHFFFRDGHVLPSATLISKRALLSVGGFSDQLRGYEDDELFLRLILSGARSVFSTHSTLNWTVNPNSVSFSHQMDDSRLIYLQHLFSLAKQMGPLAPFLITVASARFGLITMLSVFRHRSIGNENSIKASRLRIRALMSLHTENGYGALNILLALFQTLEKFLPDTFVKFFLYIVRLSRGNRTPSD